MAGDQPNSPTQTPKPPASPKAADVAADRSGVGKRWLDGAIFLFLMLFAVLLPHSIKGAQNAWKLAFILWLVKLLMERKRPRPQPLAAPLLAYVVLSAVSTALSPEPYLSWDRMKIVCLVLVGVVFAQNLRRLSQVRVLVFLLVLSGLAAAGFTAWQYTYGVGVQVTHILPGTPLYRAGVRPNDIVTRVGGRDVHTPAELEHVVLQGPPSAMLRIDALRSFPFQREETYVSGDGFRQSGLGTPSLRLARGKPSRAQGTLGHYVVFAEMLMQIGCMAWAMMLGAPSRSRGLQVLFAFAFLALAAAILVTETRAAIAGLALGCFVALLILAGRHARIWATSALLVLVIASGIWIQHSRGLHWMDSHDPGTNFRILMWEDGLHLVRQHPWFGVGMETVRIHFQEWNIRGFLQYHVMSHFHSTFLQIAVERGLLTLAAWIWFVVAYLVFLFRVQRRAQEQSRFAAGVVAGTLAGFLAFQTTSLVHYNLGEEPLVMVLFFYFGLAVAIERLLREPGAVDVG
jgi:O-antigen ligase